MRTSIFVMSLSVLLFSCTTVSIQGKKVKTSIICGDCNPGNKGKYMVLSKKTFQPEIKSNATPESIAHGLLGYVFPENNMNANQHAPCSTNSVVSPFSESMILPLDSEGGQSLFYNEKELLTINVSTTVNADIDKIREVQPTLAANVLEDFKVKLTAAYSKFANKELTINGKYYQFTLENDQVVALAKQIKYSDCHNDIYSTTNPKRMIKDIGMVYFDITSESNSVDEISSELAADATAKGIVFNIQANFKRKISSQLKKTTKDYYQIVAWRTVGITELESFR